MTSEAEKGAEVTVESITGRRVASQFAVFRTEIRDGWQEPAVRRGVYGAALMGLGALSPAYLPDASPLRSLTGNLLGHWAVQAAAMSLMLIGVVVLFDAWLRIRPRAGQVMPATSRAILTLWSLPIIAAPPLFSKDAFSYAAQGRLVIDGVDPYTYSPWVLLERSFKDLVDPLWLTTPAPYGPVSLEINRAVVEVAARDAWWSSVLMRLPALAGVLLLVWALPRLAETWDRDPDRALWLGVLNPLVMMHFIGGSHNDAVMVGLGAVAIVWATRGRLVMSAALVATAALVKQPIAAILPATTALALMHIHGTYRLSLRQAVRGCLAAGATFVGAMGLITAATGLGFGWIKAASVPGMVGSLSPSTNIGEGLRLLFQIGHATSAAESAIPVTRMVFLGIAALAIVVMSLRVLHDTRRAPAMIAWGLILCAACLPALQVWYFLWGAVFLGLVEMSAQRERWVHFAMVALLGYSTIDAVFRTGLTSFLIIGIVALVWPYITRRDTDSATYSAGKVASSLRSDLWRTLR